MSASKPVILVIDSRLTGGIETHLVTLAIALRDSGECVHVIRLQDFGAHPMVDQLHALAIPVTTLDGRLRTLIKTLRRLKGKVIHAHGYKANLFCRMAALQLDLPCVTTFHNGDIGEGKLRLYTWLDELTACLSENIAVSREIMARLSGRAELVPNFVRLHPLTEPGPRTQIAFVGRLECVKGPKRFIELAARFPNLAFHIYGDGRLRRSLEAEATPNVSFHGFVADMGPYWRDIDILIMPSESEGLPLAALEAMSHSIPVIASAVGQLPEVLQHGVNGYLCERTVPSLEASLSAWRRLSPRQQQSLRQHARKTVEHHYADTAVIPRVLEIYQTAISKRGEVSL